MNSLVKDLSLLGLRLAFGGLMLLNHGWPKFQKLMDHFGGAEVKFANVLGMGMIPSLFLAVFSEVLCAGLLVLGLFTRKASLPLIITMFIAAFVIHFGDPIKDKEMALLYLAAYMAIGAYGAGRFSLDDKLLNK